MVALRGGNKVREALERIENNLKKARVTQAGFMNGATEADGTLVAAVAAFNEFGTSNSPPRPFMRDTFNDNGHRWPKNLATALKANNYNAYRALDLVGQEIQEEIQESIRKFTTPALAQSTIDRKGFDKPLIETSTMLNSVTHRVIK